MDYWIVGLLWNSVAHAGPNSMALLIGLVLFVALGIEQKTNRQQDRLKLGERERERAGTRRNSLPQPACKVPSFTAHRCNARPSSCGQFSSVAVMNTCPRDW